MQSRYSFLLAAVVVASSWAGQPLQAAAAPETATAFAARDFDFDLLPPHVGQAGEFAGAARDFDFDLGRSCAGTARAPHDRDFDFGD